MGEAEDDVAEPGDGEGKDEADGDDEGEKREEPADGVDLVEEVVGEPGNGEQKRGRLEGDGEKPWAGGDEPTADGPGAVFQVV